MSRFHDFFQLEWDKTIFFSSQLYGHFCGSSYSFNPVVKNIFLLIVCKIFLSEKKSRLYLSLISNVLNVKNHN